MCVQRGLTSARLLYVTGTTLSSSPLETQLLDGLENPVLVSPVHSENKYCVSTCLLLSLSCRVKGSLTHLKRDTFYLGLLKHAKESLLNPVSRPILCCQGHF